MQVSKIESNELYGSKYAGMQVGKYDIYYLRLSIWNFVSEICQNNKNLYWNMQYKFSKKIVTFRNYSATRYFLNTTSN